MPWGYAAGAIAGAVANSALSDSGGTQQSSQTSEPWWAVQPYLTDIFYNARQRYESGQLTPQLSPYTTQAAGQLAQSAGAGGLVSQAQDQLGKTLGGSYLSADSNPYLQGTVQQALDQVRQNVSGTFSGDNFGSSANREYLTKQLASTALPIYAQNYANERQNQLNAIGAAPGLQSANAMQLAQAGSLLQPQYDAPYTALQRYASLVSGQPGGSTTSTTPYYTNPFASALGAGIGGLTLYNGFKGSGIFGGGGGTTTGGSTFGGYNDAISQPYA